MRINENFLKYKIYESAIETGSEDLYYQLLDEGVFGDFMGKLKGLFGSKEEQQEVDKAMQEVEKPLTKIVSSLKVAGKKPDEIKAFIGNVIDKVLKAAPEKASGAGAGDGAPSGTPVTPDSAAAQGAMARAAATAAGQNPDQAEKKAADMKPDAVYDSLVKGFAKRTGVELQKVKSILDYITKNKLLQVEGRLVSQFDLRRVVNELHSAERDEILMERWQVLAGVHNDVLLQEKFNPKNILALAGKGLTQIKGKAPQIQGFVKGALDKFKDPTTKAKFADILKQYKIDLSNPETFKDLKDDVLKKLGDFITTNKAKLEDTPEGGAAAGDKAGGGPSVSPEAEKKFGGLADKLIGKLKGVKKPEILTVLKALDDSNLEVKPG